MTAHNSVEKLVGITTRLGELIGHENGILVHRRPHELVTSQQEKERLVVDYEREMKELSLNPQTIGSTSAETLGRLKDATRRFQEVMEEHRRLVQSAKSVSDRMIKTITEEVSNRQSPVTGYTAKAEMRSPLARSRGPVSLALNELV